MPSSPPLVMVFAATDPTGGAGLQADVMTLASLGCHPLSVVTATTAQDTHGVRAIRALESEWLREQACAVLQELPVAAFKLGVIGSAENAHAIAELLGQHPGIPVVLDPVLASGRGDPLTSRATVAAIRARLLPLATIVTPNSIEARELAGCAPGTALAECAAMLVRSGARHVLITGGHETGADVRNVLHDASGAIGEGRWQRLPGEYHGSGCTLASAIAAELAHGLPMPEAVRRAEEYTWHALARGFRPADGQFLPDRLQRALGQ
ncbi:MAG TPA: hydroxymethylpyrimidine/phosphomethylpyrimidine kinase [Burkholderiales bacterium]|nr:hydroxymethylpyrimidine/phosphomethylpyrimidine kinase [Burkholderiales bacterium]